MFDFEVLKCYLKRIYEIHLKDDKIDRDILLTKFDMKILFKEYTHPKILLDVITKAYHASSETYVQILIERLMEP